MSEPEVWAHSAEYDAAASAWMSDTVDVWSRELHPVLASVRTEHVADLPRPEEHTPETAELASPLHRDIAASHAVTVDVHDTLHGDVDSFLAIAFEISDAFGSQLTKSILEHISEISDASGQTIDAGGRDIFDVMLDSLETIDISFDENGEHNLTMVMHSEAAERLRDKQPTPEQEARLQQILERRRKEWNASRRRHDLPGDAD